MKHFFTITFLVSIAGISAGERSTSCKILKLLEDPPKGMSYKISGSPLGFSSLHHPVQYWEAQDPEKRWIGKLSNSFTWDEIDRIYVVCCNMHIRHPGDVESLIRKRIAEAKFIKQLPPDFSVSSKDDERFLLVQAIIDLKQKGKGVVRDRRGRVLVSISSRWTVVEHRHKVGLSLN